MLHRATLRRVLLGALAALWLAAPLAAQKPAAQKPAGAKPGASGSTDPGRAESPPSDAKPADAKQAETSARTATVALQNDALRKELALAKGTDFYLLVDPVRRTLRLMLSGVVLEEYHLHDLAIGTFRAPFQRSSALNPAGLLATQGALDPPRERDRFELVVGPGETDPPPEPPVPPPAEEIYRIPPRYWIRYADGVAVEVRSREESRKASLKTLVLEHIWEPLRMALADLRNKNRDKVRLLLEMSREDAAALYRVLPPDTKLLVLPPT